MIQSLMVGLTEKDMQAYVNSLTLNSFIYPALFPLKQQYTLSWKALSITTGLRVMGDLVARGASVNAKTREAVDKIMGTIPKVAFKMEMNENVKEQYDIMLKMSEGDARKRALVEAWAPDVQACWDGVAARIEWYALQQISRGKVTITDDNNDGILSEYDIDYDIPSEQKFGFQDKSAAWTDTTNAHPITVDFKAVVKYMRSKGKYPAFALMNSDTFSLFAATEEVIKKSATVAANMLEAADTPSVDQVNAALLKLPYLHGLQIKVVEQNIIREKKDGTRLPGANPFADNAVTFTENLSLGETLYKIPAEAAGVQGSAAYRVVSGHTMIKKYAIEEPLKEVTLGTANAIPAWYGAKRCALFDCAHSTFKID